MSQNLPPFPTSPQGAVRLALENRKLVLFVGAGLSKGAGLPDWVELIQPLSQVMGTPFPAQTPLINDRHLLNTADRYEHAMGRPALIQYLQGRLRVKARPTMVHELIAKMPISEIFTTNYDAIIEKVLRSQGKGCNCIVTRDDLSFIQPNEVTIYKLCGDLERWENVLITETDFFAFFKEKLPLAKCLEVAFSRNTTLFLGYSLQDPFFKYIWYNTGIEFGPDKRQGFAVMFNADPHDVYDLQRRNITVINLEAEPEQRTAALARWLQDLMPPPPYSLSRPPGWGAPSADSGASDLRGLLEQVLEITRRREKSPANNYYEQEERVGEQIGRDVEGWIEIGRYAYLMGTDDRQRGLLETARQLCELSWKIMKQLEFPWGQAEALGELVLIAQAEGELEQAHWYATEDLELRKNLGDNIGIAWITRQLGVIARLQGDYEGARELCERSLRICETDKYDTTEVLHELCLIAQEQGDLEAASKFAERSVVEDDAPEHRSRRAWVLNQKGRIARLEDKLDEARLLCEESFELYKELDQPVNLATVLNDLSLIAEALGEPERARELTEQSLAICDEKITDARAARPVKAWALNQKGKLARQRGDFAEARRACEEALKLYEQLGKPIEITMVLDELGFIARDQGQLDDARSYAERSLQMAEERGHKASAASAAYQLGLLAVQRGYADEALQHYAKSLWFYQVLNESERIRECVEQIERVAGRTGRHAAVDVLQRAMFFYRQPQSASALIIEDCLKRLTAAPR
ncbi:MAG TPA: tetratricopeptide repeat protein [Pyrinomonadaceae bacterium]|nr:tetratricopeptide repeat protein [Pyrinomonadaceae bacterium]